VEKLVVAKRKAPAKGGGFALNTKSSKLDHYTYGKGIYI
jgi:hypothetical protein